MHSPLVKPSPLSKNCTYPDAYRNKVNDQEGRGRGRLDCYWRFNRYFKHNVAFSALNITQLACNINLGYPEHSSFKVASQQSVPLSLLLLSQSFYAVSPSHSLERDTGVCHLHLTHLFTARLPTLSPAADLAEPRPPRHIPPPPDSGPPISGEEVSHSHLHPRSVDHLELKRL